MSPTIALLVERYMLSLDPRAHKFYARRLPPRFCPYLKRWLRTRRAARPEGELQLPLRELAPSTTPATGAHRLQSPGHGSSPARGNCIVTAVHGSRGLPVPLPHAHLPDGLPRDALPALQTIERKFLACWQSGLGVGVWGRILPDAMAATSYSKTKNESEPTLVEERERIQNSLLLPAQREQIGLSVRFSPTYELLLLSRVGFKASGYRLTQGLKPMRWDEAQSEILKPSGADKKRNAPE
jgi:hypothetical protein